MQWVRGQWDRVAAWAAIGVGALALMLGWLGVRSEALTQKQIPYIISGGIGGILLVAVGAMLWLSADLRDEWRKLDAIERKLDGAQADVTDDPFVGADEPDGTRTRAAADEPVRSSRAGRRPKLHAPS
jgi:hypothetical protein